MRVCLVLCMLLCAGLTSTGQPRASIDSLTQRLKQVEDEEKVATLNQLALAYVHYKPDSVVYHATQALQLAQRIADQEGEALSLVRLGRGFGLQGNWSEGLERLHQSLEIAKAHQYDEVLARAYLRLGTIHKNQSNYKTALKYQLQALGKAQQLGDTAFIAKIHNNIGIVYLRKADFPQALHHFTISLRYKRQYDPAQLGSTYQNIGNLYFRLDSLNKAIHYYRKATESYQQQPRRMASNAISLGLAFIDNQQFDSAHVILQKALATFASLNDSVEQTSTLMNLAWLQEAQELYKPALAYYERAARQAPYNYDPAKRINIVANKADCYLALEQLDSARYYYQKTVQLADSLDYLDMEYAGIAGLAQCYETLGKLTQANNYYRQLVALADALHAQSLDSELFEQLMRFEAEEKEYALQLASKDLIINQTAAGREYYRKLAWVFVVLLSLGFLAWGVYRYRHKWQLLKKIEAARQEEHKHLGDYLHDSVSVVFSTMRMHLHEAAAVLDTNHADAHNKLHLADRLVLKASDMVRNTSHRLVRGTFAQAGLAAGIRDLCQEINSAGQVQVTCTLVGKLHKLEPVYASMVYRGVSESLNNVLKHAQATQAQVLIRLDAKTLLTKVSDNGIGLDPTHVDYKLGIGLNKLRQQIESLGGTLTIDNQSGTTITFILYPYEPSLPKENTS